MPSLISSPKIALVVVALGDQRRAWPVGQRPDLAVGDERRAPVQAVEDDVLAHRRREPQRRAVVAIHGRDDLARSAAP